MDNPGVSASRVALALVSLVFACQRPSTESPAPYTAFGDSEPVRVSGWDSDIMEPFISRDGAFLFFNDNAQSSPEKDLYWAKSDGSLGFIYGGKLAGLSSNKVDGAPSLDESGRLYYISLGAYDPYNSVAPEFATVFAADWDPVSRQASGAAAIRGLSTNTPMLIVFDIECCADGTLLLTSLGNFISGNKYPSASDILYATDGGSGFTVAPENAAIMAEVNAGGIEYAACISADKLELFFNRASAGFRSLAIYRSTRQDTASPFTDIQRVDAIRGFAEGPALSPDEKTLYFHKRDDVSGKFLLYRATRP